MKIQELLNNLEYWAECLENPTYNSLEVGFRHNPLSKDEIIQRYSDECRLTREAILRVKEMIEKDGIR